MPLAPNRRRSRLFGITLAAGLSLVVVVGSTPARAQASAAEQAVARQLLEDGKRLFQQKKYGEAAQKFRQAYEIDPSQKVGLYNAAFALRKGGDLKEARAAYLEFIAVAPDDLDAVFGLAETERLLGNKAEALRLFTNYLTRENRSGKDKYIAYAKQKSEDLREAATSPEASSTKGEVEQAMEQGQEAYKAGRYRKAAEHFLRAYAKDGEQVDALYRRALSLRKAKDYSAAIQAYKAYLQKEPGSLDGLFGLAETHRLAGNKPEAKRLFEDYVQRERRAARARYITYAKKQIQALKAAPQGPSGGDKAVARKLLDDGKQAYAEKDYAAAADLFGRAHELDPALDEALYRRGLASRRAGDLEGAKEAYERFLEKSPDHADGHYGLAETNRLRDDTAGARKHFARYVELEKRPSEQRYVERAKQYLEATGGLAVNDDEGETDDGEAAATEEGEEGEEEETAQAEAGAEDAEDAEQPAVAEADQGAAEGGEGQQLGPRADLHSSAFAKRVTIDGLLDHGRVALNAGAPEKAAEHFKLALALDPSSGVARLLYGQALEQLDEPAKARQQYEKVVESGDEQLAGLARSRLASGKSGGGFGGPTATQVSKASEALEKARAASATGDYDGALSLLEKAAELNPRSVQAFLMAGEIHLARRKGLRALQAYQRALALAPERAAPLYGIARAYELAGERRVSLHHYRLYARSDADDVDKDLQRKAWLKAEGVEWPLRQ